MTATRVVDRRPPPSLMVPCDREPEPPPRGAGSKANEHWVAGVIVAGENCRQRADGLQGHYKAAPK